MKASKTVGIAVAAALVGSAVTLMLVNRVASRGGVAEAHVVDAKGNLRVPRNYRALYQPLGSWAIAADSGRSSKEMHEVYASPGAIDAYHAAGHFPDGTVLVKEVFGTSTTGMTTGTVSHATRLKGWFVMVRDSKNTRRGTLCGAMAGDGRGSMQTNLRRQHRPTTKRIARDATCQPERQTGSTPAAIRP
jgi:hypothetical protein